MIFSIAWKNVWRNKTRSLVVIMAIAFGLWGGIFSISFMNGLLMGRLNDAIKIEVSSLQLHNADFMENDEIRYTLKNADALVDTLARYPGVEAVSKRFVTEVMINSNRSAAGVKLLGIVPEQEKKVSELYEHLVDSNSSYLDVRRRMPIVIGRKLAEKLKVHIRSKLMINTVDFQGNAVQEVFRVVGIFKTQNSGFDEYNVFIRFSDAQRIFGMPAGEAHEIAVLMKDMMATDQINLDLKRRYTRFRIDDKALLRARNDSIPDEVYSVLLKMKSDKVWTYDEFAHMMQQQLGEDLWQTHAKQIRQLCEAGIDVSQWKFLSPELAMQSTWMDTMTYIFVGIILAALGFGIVNTMLMAVLERIRELGMLIAIGMNRRRVFLMIVLETVMLSLTGGVLGIILGSVTVSLLSKTGMNFSEFSQGMEALGYPSTVHPFIELRSYISITLMVILTGIMSAIYPALHAIRLKPAEAIRKE